MKANVDPALEMARARIRTWFEERDRPFRLKKKSHRGYWLVAVGALCVVMMVGSHAPVLEALSNLPSAFGA